MTEAISAIGAESLRADFMNLLVTQLQHQDPLDPMKNEDLTMQLATLSQLQATEDMSGKFTDLLNRFELTEGGKMIGRVVDFIPPELNERISGLVSGVQVENGTIMLSIGQFKVKLEDVLAISPYTGQQAGETPTEAPTQLVGDLNLDNKVDEMDMEILQENHGISVGATWAQGDLNGDGAVNHIDYEVLMRHYGESIEDAAGEDAAGDDTNQDDTGDDPGDA